MQDPSFFALLPAFRFGIYDSLNPCNFATALIFALYLSRVGGTTWRLFFLGAVFIFVSMFTHFNLANGAYDAYVNHPFMMDIFKFAYVLLAFVFIAVAIVSLTDRWRYEKSHDPSKFLLGTPVFLKEKTKKSVLHLKNFTGLLWSILIAFGVSFGMTLCSSIYPQREYIFIVHSYMMAEGNTQFAFLSFLQYSVALVLPLILILAAIYFLNFMKGKIKAVLYYKGISAALFLAVGGGLALFLFT